MKNALRVIKANRQYVVMAAIILMLGTVLGMIFADVFYSLIEDQLEKIQELANQIVGNGNPLYAAWVIFKNNLVAATVLILSGSFFAIFPIFGLLINGVMIGVVLNMVSGISMSTLLVLVVGILPHGILEIPAIIIAGGFGIKLGLVWLFPDKNISRWQSYLNTWKDTLQIAPFIFLLLVGAALIEGVVTPALMQMFLNTN